MGLIPEFLRGQSLKFNLSSPRVPMDDVLLQLGFKRLEVRELLIPEELVLDVAEHLLGRPVVDAVPLSRHALDYPSTPKRIAV